MNEPDQVNNQSGTGEANDSIVGGGVDIGGDDTVDIERVIEVFNENTLRIYKTPEVRKQYTEVFRKFYKDTGLSTYTRQQLKTRKGHDLILNWLDKAGKRSRITYKAKLKSVWEYGLKLAWPIVKKDFGRHYFAQSIPGRAPPDDVVKKWVDAVRMEPDAYLGSMMRCQFEFGWRLINQTSNLKIRNIHFKDGRPDSIIAYGDQENFKTHSSIIAKLDPETSDILNRWLNELKQILKCANLPPTMPIWPWRSLRHGTDAKIDPMKPLSEQADEWWERFQVKWELPDMTTRECRSWVKLKLKELKVPKVCRYVRHGHAIQYNDMDDRYGPTIATKGDDESDMDPNDLDKLLSMQEQHLPCGLLGAIFEPQVRIVNQIPVELEGLWADYVANKLGDLELMTALASLKRKCKQVGVYTEV